MRLSLASLVVAVVAPSSSVAAVSSDKPADSANVLNSAPCATAANGMVCIPAGAAVVGSDAAGNEKPQRTVQLSTFYIDTSEVTNAEYKICADAGACPSMKGPGKPEPSAPVKGLDFPTATKLCTFMGKRLPTEWEWEKAARGADGEVSSWGNDPPSCDKTSAKGASKECRPPKGAAAAASIAAGRFGLVDMGGNYEWTSSWIGILGRKKVEPPQVPQAEPGKPAKAVSLAMPRKDTDPCQECEGIDPRGPCDSESPCSDGGERKIARGGGWWLPAAEVRASHRRAFYPGTGNDKIAVRCASTTATLAKFPARIATEKRATPALPSPPTPEQLTQFAELTEDKLDTQKCEKRGRAFLDCRDPNSYIKSNEPRQQLWRPYLENVGGGYSGVGIDQNYTFIAAARSEWAWLFDYDPAVVRLHWVLRAVILASANRGELVDRFRPEREGATVKVIDEAYQGHPEAGAFREVYRVSRAALLAYYQRQLTGEGGDPTFGWLASDDNYAYIKLLYEQGRIRAFKGNMLAKDTMQGIGGAAKKMGVTIRVYYPSNAPECWPLTKDYKDNVLALPFDDKTIVLQTISGLAPGYEKLTGHWHYNVQSGAQQQELIRRKGTVLMKQLLEVRNKTQDPDLTISGLAAAD